MRLLYLAILGVLLFSSVTTTAQTQDELLNLLTKKGTITQSEADSIRAKYSSKSSGLRISSLDSFPALTFGNAFRLNGFTQFRYQNYQQAGKYDGFDIRRARLDFQGDFAGKWSYRLLVDFIGAQLASGTAPTGGSLLSPNLLDAFIAYKPFSFLKITAGQMIIPFSVENTTQDRYLETPDRSQVVSALVARKGDASNGLVDSIGNQNGRDIGLQLSGSLIKTNNRYLLDYYLALFNGAGINVADNNQSKDIVGRLIVHPFKILDIGGSYYNGFDRFTSSTTKNQNRIRWGTDVVLNYKLLSVKSEYIRGYDGNSNPTTHDGWYAQASYYFAHKRLQGVFRYDTYDPNLAKSNVVSTYYVLGVNYFINALCKLQVDYSIRNEQGPAIPNNLFTTQFQLGF